MSGAPCDQLDAEILKAQEKIENLSAVLSDTAIINELARKVNELYGDRRGISNTLGTYLTKAAATYKTAFSYDNLLTEARQITGNSIVPGLE